MCEAIIILVTVAGPTITAIVALKRYIYEKNRNIYERRLNEVYAPLYALLVRQEAFRKLYLPDVTREEAPILTSEKRKTSFKLDLAEGKMDHSVKEEVGFLDRKEFIRIMQQTNFGLARPKLLILLNQYELLIYLEENVEKESEKWKKATSKKVEVELDLIDEIISGYKETIQKLQLDDKFDIHDLEAI